MNPFNYFAGIFYINLDSRLDRRNETIKEFQKYGIGAVRVPGVVYRGFGNKHRDACFGNHLAHANCLEIAKRNNLPCCLIFEDDVEFFEEAVENLSQAIIELPKDWDMFYLGANMDRFSAYQISDHIARLEGAFATHAYAVKDCLYDKLIELNRNKEIVHNDVAYAEQIMPKYNCYISIPLIAGQRKSFSDIQGTMMNSNPVFKERFKGKLIKK